MITIQNNKTLEDVYEGKIDYVDYVTITNSGTSSVDAFVYVLYDGSLETKGISISTTYSGVYTGIDDSVFINRENKNTSIFDATFENTETDSNGWVVLSDTSLAGNYISQVLPFDSSRMVNTFISDYTSSSGTAINLYYRCSNIEPIGLDEIYWNASEKFNLYTQETTVFTSWGITPLAICFDEAFGEAVVSLDNYIKTYNSVTGALVKTNVSDDLNEFEHTARFTGGYIWGYNGSNLRVVNSRSSVTKMDLNFGTSDFLYDFTSPTTSGTFWYTNQVSNNLVHANEEGDTIASFYLNKPRAVCVTNDDGCWVIDNKFKMLYRYSNTHEVLVSKELDYAVYVLEEDGANGFWACSRYELLHFDSTGSVLFSIPAPDVSRVIRGYKKLFLYSAKGEYLTVIDLEGNLIHRVDENSKAYKNVPGILSIGFTEGVGKDYVSFPLSYDPVWGDKSNLGWNAIPADGYLDKAKYYQFKAEFSSSSGLSSAALKELGMTKGLMFDNMAPNETRNIYIKNESSLLLTEGSYNIKLNCIWNTING